jgi:hypothetical protein
MHPRTRRSLDGLLVIGPHRLDSQFRALTAYAARTGHALDVCWVVIPGEDPATAAPDSDFPIVAFDDEIAGFTPEEFLASSASGDAPGDRTTDWHVAYDPPRAKRPTSHLPVYGCPGERETGADAILCAGAESLDRQIARIEAYAIRSAIRLGGVYLARDAHNLQVLLRDFSASNRALGTGITLTVGPDGSVGVHD